VEKVGRTRFARAFTVHWIKIIQPQILNKSESCETPFQMSAAYAGFSHRLCRNKRAGSGSGGIVNPATPMKRKIVLPGATLYPGSRGPTAHAPKGT